MINFIDKNAADASRFKILYGRFFSTIKMYTGGVFTSVIGPIATFCRTEMPGLASRRGRSFHHEKVAMPALADGRVLS